MAKTRKDDMPDLCAEGDGYHVDTILGKRVAAWMKKQFPHCGEPLAGDSQWYPYTNFLYVSELSRPERKKLFDWLVKLGYEVGDA